MKARSREINIFNMSLLDILCGALGAFCFMMLVLFPYYSQDKGQGKRPDVQEGVDPKTFQDAKARVQQLEDTLKKFQHYADQMEARLKQLEAQARQQQGDMQQMQQRAEQAEMRNPILAVGSFPGIQDGEQIDIYIDSSREHANKSPVEKMDPAKHQDVQFSGDLSASGPGSALSYYMVRDTPRDSEYRIYAKVIKLNAGHTVNGILVVNGNDLFKAFAIKALNEKTAVPIAVMKVDAKHNAKMDSIVPPENMVK